MRGKTAATAVVVLVGSLTVIGPAQTAQAACGWHRVSAPEPNEVIVQMTGVDARSQNDAWAVGTSIRLEAGGQLQVNSPLTEHWNGKAWKQIPISHLTGANETLASVAMVSAKDVWAVGSYETLNNSNDRTLIHHWNGTKWSVVKSPNVGTKGNRLLAVDSISSDNVWAVGDYTDSGSNTQSLIEHWNGHKWSVVSHPTVSPPETFADVVRIPGTTRAWAVGSYSSSTLVERSFGTTWATVASPNEGAFPSRLDGVAATSTTDAWAVGSYSNGVEKTLIEAWDGSVWAIVPSPNVGTEGTTLTDVASHSGTSAWALGQKTVGGDLRIVAERWNGSTWKVGAFPNVGVAENDVTDVAAIPGQNSAWATGAYYDNDGVHALIERYC